MLIYLKCCQLTGRNTMMPVTWSGRVVLTLRLLVAILMAPAVALACPVVAFAAHWCWGARYSVRMQ